MDRKHYQDRETECLLAAEGVRERLARELPVEHREAMLTIAKAWRNHAEKAGRQANTSKAKKPE
jgi:hypothetical protein